MGKALMVYAREGTIGNNQYYNAAGGDATSGTETNSLFIAPYDLTFTRLGQGISAVSAGDSQVHFRNNGADGNNVTPTLAAAGTSYDTTHSDTVTAGNTFNFRQGEVGNNTTMIWGKVTLDAGATNHGNIHGISNFAGAVFDVDSATRYSPLTGAMQADGITTESQTQWLNRAYTGWQSIHVRVTANARATDATMVVRNRINEGFGGLTVSIGASATGVIASTGTPDTLANADRLNTSITLGADSLADLTISAIWSYLTSSTLKSDTACAGIASFLRAASATEHFFPIGGRVTTFFPGTTTLTDATARIAPGFAATCSNFRFNVLVNTYTGTATFKVYKNGVEVMSIDVATLATGWHEYTATTFDIDDDDELSFSVQGGTATGASGMAIGSCGITFSPIAAGKPWNAYAQQQ